MIMHKNAPIMCEKPTNAQGYTIVNRTTHEYGTKESKNTLCFLIIEQTGHSRDKMAVEPNTDGRLHLISSEHPNLHKRKQYKLLSEYCAQSSKWSK